MTNPEGEDSFYEVYGISSKRNHAYFNSFLGIESLDNAIEKAEIIWSRIWEKLEIKGETPRLVHFRNPYDPENVSLYTKGMFDKRLDYILSSEIGGKDGMNVLLNNLKEKRAIPRRDRALWSYCISGMIHLNSDEMIQLNIDRFNPSGGFYRPYVAKPRIVRGWLEQQIPSRMSNEAFEQFFDLDELVLDFKK